MKFRLHHPPFYSKALAPSKFAPWLGRILLQVDNKATTISVSCPPHMEKPDILHEASQRSIFNFLIEHRGEGFMELETDITHRQADPAALHVIDAEGSCP